MSAAVSDQLTRALQCSRHEPWHLGLVTAYTLPYSGVNRQAGVIYRYKLTINGYKQSVSLLHAGSACRGSAEAATLLAAAAAYCHYVLALPRPRTAYSEYVLRPGRTHVLVLSASGDGLPENSPGVERLPSNAADPLAVQVIIIIRVVSNTVTAWQAVAPRSSGIWLLSECRANLTQMFGIPNI
jgi:hypothetical protein